MTTQELLRRKRKELFKETKFLQGTYLSLDTTKKKQKEISFKLKQKENETFKKQMFYSKLLKEMEKKEK